MFLGNFSTKLKKLVNKSSEHYSSDKSPDPIFHPISLLGHNLIILGPPFCLFSFPLGAEALPVQTNGPWSSCLVATPPLRLGNRLALPPLQVTDTIFTDLSPTSPCDRIVELKLTLSTSAQVTKQTVLELKVKIDL